MNVVAVIGSAIVEVVGLNPQEFEEESEGLWPHSTVFGDGPFYQDTGSGEAKLRLKLAARPHLMGGLDAFEALKKHERARDVVPYIRIGGALAGSVIGEVAVKRVKRVESKLAPDRRGRRHDIEVELLLVGSQASGSDWA